MRRGQESCLLSDYDSYFPIIARIHHTSVEKNIKHLLDGRYLDAWWTSHWLTGTRSHLVKKQWARVILIYPKKTSRGCFSCRISADEAREKVGPTRLRKQTAMGEGKKFHHELPSHQRFLSLVLLLLNSWKSDYSEFCSASMLFCGTLFLVEPISASISSLILMRFCFLLCMLPITSVPLGFITTFFFFFLVRNWISEATGQRNLQ